MGSTAEAQMRGVWKLIERGRGKDADKARQSIKRSLCEQFDYVDYYGAGVCIGLLMRDTSLTLDMIDRYEEYAPSDAQRQQLIEYQLPCARRWVHRSSNPSEALPVLDYLITLAAEVEDKARLIELTADAFDREADSTRLWNISSVHRYSRFTQADLRKKAAANRAAAAELRNKIDSSETTPAS